MTCLVENAIKFKHKFTHVFFKWAKYLKIVIYQILLKINKKLIFFNKLYGWLTTNISSTLHFARCWHRYAPFVLVTSQQKSNGPSGGGPSLQPAWNSSSTCIQKHKHEYEKAVFCTSFYSLYTVAVQCGLCFLISLMISMVWWNSSIMRDNPSTIHITGSSIKIDMNMSPPNQLNFLKDTSHQQSSETILSMIV